MSQVFFTDRDLGRKIPDALAAAGYSVERHDDHFGPLTLDTDWIREIGHRGWIAFSHNKDIRYRSQERDMVMRAGVEAGGLNAEAEDVMLYQSWLDRRS